MQRVVSGDQPEPCVLSGFLRHGVASHANLFVPVFLNAGLSTFGHDLRYAYG